MRLLPDTNRRDSTSRQHRPDVVVSRIKIALVVGIIAFFTGHTLWANEPIPAQPRYNSVAPTSQLAEWITANANITIPQQCAKWWADMEIFPAVSGSSGATSDPLDVIAPGSPPWSLSKPYVSIISRLVATNSRFYRLIDGGLRHQWQPVAPGTIEVVPATTELWLNTINGYSRQAWKRTPDASFCDMASTYGHSITPVELHDPQSELDDIVPVLQTLMKLRTNSAVAHQRYDFAAQDAVQELKLDVDCVQVPCNSGTIQVVPLSNLNSALNELIWLSSHLSERTAMHVVRQLIRIESSLPDIKSLTNNNLLFNRVRLQNYLRCHTITPQTVSTAVANELVKLSSTDQHGFHVSKRWVVPQSIALSKRNILADYDADTQKFCNLKSPYRSATLTRQFLGRRLHDSIAFTAFNPLEISQMEWYLQRAITKIRIVRIAFALNGYADSNGRLPESLEKLCPVFLHRIPRSALIAPDGTLLPIGYGIPKAGNARFVLYVVNPLSTERHSIDSRRLPRNPGNYDGSPQWSIMHYAFKLKSTVGAR